MAYSRNSRGQASIELVVGVMFLLMIFSVAMMLANQKMSESSELKAYLDAKRVGRSVKLNIEAVGEQGPGYFKYFSVPGKIQGGYNYTVTVSGNVLEVLYHGRRWSTRLGVGNVTIHSIDYGLEFSNRVVYAPQGIVVVGHRPNLLPVTQSLSFDYNSSSNVILVFIDVKNDAHVGSPASTLSFSQFHGGMMEPAVFAQVPAIPAFESVRVCLEDTLYGGGGLKTFVFEVDAEGVVDEGVEDDNVVEKTVYVP